MTHMLSNKTFHNHVYPDHPYADQMAAYILIYYFKIIFIEDFTQPSLYYVEQLLHLDQPVRQYNFNVYCRLRYSKSNISEKKFGKHTNMLQDPHILQQLHQRIGQDLSMYKLVKHTLYHQEYQQIHNQIQQHRSLSRIQYMLHNSTIPQFKIFKNNK